MLSCADLTCFNRFCFYFSKATIVLFVYEVTTAQMLLTIELEIDLNRLAPIMKEFVIELEDLVEIAGH